MKLRNILPALLLLVLGACTNDDPNPEPEPEPPVNVDGEGETPDYDPESIPSFNYDIAPYGGETATDAVSYQPGNADLNPDENNWENIVSIVYNGNSATVTAPAGVIHTAIGANITLNLGNTKGARVVLSGSSDAGSLTLTGYYKHMIELDNLTLRATDCPAINDQIAKRVFLMLKGHNRLADGENYEYKTSKRKGCFYAADHVIVCGDGVLEVVGNNRHGFATDGFLFMNPGATLAVTDARKNAIHVDGSGINNGYRGIEVTGGYIYAHTSAPAGKAMKCDGRIALRGGRLSLNVSGNAAIDPDDATLSSPCCLKSDSTITISGGEILLTATGMGAKGITADFDLNIAGGMLTVANSGKATSEGSDSSVPKALNAHGNINITAGGIDISAIGMGSTALSSDASLTMSDGVVYAFGAYYGVKAANAEATGGTLLCGSARNTAVEGVTVYPYENVAAGLVTVLTSPDGTTAAAFCWPLDLTSATLLHR